MPQLNGAIGQQGFELVRYRLCEILADEFPRQYELNYGDDTLDVTIWMERFWAFDNSELPALNVRYLNGDFENHNHGGSARHTAQYEVQCHTFAVDRDEDSGAIKDKSGDSLAVVKCQQLMGVVRAIIENPVYKMLGFEPNFIFSRKCTRMEMMKMGEKDAKNTAVGRVIVEVDVHESADLIQPNLLSGYETTVTIGNSSKGHFFTPRREYRITINGIYLMINSQFITISTTL